MPLTQTGAQMIDAIRRMADVKGTSALARHPNADCYDYLNKGLGSLHRKLIDGIPDQRTLSSSAISVVAGTSLYSLPSDFHHLISTDLTMNGVKRWIESYEMNERPTLTDPSTPNTSLPFLYRLRGSSVELLPTASSAGTFTLWYVPTPKQYATDGSDSSTLFDTIDRLDEYPIAYGARLISIRDNNQSRISMCTQLMNELEAEIRVTARNRDKNTQDRILDERIADRYGSTRFRRWR